METAHVHLLKSFLLVSSLWCSGTVTAMQMTATDLPPGTALELEEGAPGELIEELDEVLVSGARRVRSRKALLAWIKRLSGQFTYEGHVQLGDDGVSRGTSAVTGAGRCVVFGRDPSPVVQCAIQVTWPEVSGGDERQLPGGTSTLVPAMIMYGIDVDYLGIRHLQVDNRGVAEGGLGYLRGSTLTTITPCADQAQDCRRTSRITAKPDGRLVQVDIEIERSSRRAYRHVFVMHRVGPISVAPTSKDEGRRGR